MEPNHACSTTLVESANEIADLKRALAAAQRTEANDRDALAQAQAQLAQATNAKAEAASTSVALADAVRVQPDDWPPYADAAWMRIADVNGDAELRALVVQDDRSRLPETNA